MDSAKKGGIFIGKSHEDGGIKAVVDGKPIEVQGGEGILTTETMEMKDVVTLTGTPCEIASELNQMGGGVAMPCNNVGDTKGSFKDGGLVKSISSNLENLNKNGIVLKKGNVTVILYNTGGQSRSLGLYDSTLLYNTIKSIDSNIASEIVVMLNHGIHDEFQEGKDYSNDNLIIMNQNEVVYNGDKFEKGGIVSDNEMPDSEILRYGQKLKKDHPEIWDSGGNIRGNESFENLIEISQRGYWLKEEQEFYGRWQSFKARHQHNHNLAGVVANIKWASWGNIGKEGAMEVIEGSRKFEEGGKVDKLNKGRLKSYLDKKFTYPEGVMTRREHLDTYDASTLEVKSAKDYKFIDKIKSDSEKFPSISGNMEYGNNKDWLAKVLFTYKLSGDTERYERYLKWYDTLQKSSKLYVDKLILEYEGKAKKDEYFIKDKKGQTFYLDKFDYLYLIDKPKIKEDDKTEFTPIPVPSQDVFWEVAKYMKLEDKEIIENGNPKNWTNEELREYFDDSWDLVGETPRDLNEYKKWITEFKNKIGEEFEKRYSKEIIPIRQLGTGANVYYESEKYRVNYFERGNNGNFILLIQSNDPLELVPVAIKEFTTAEEAVKVAEKLQFLYPNGVPSAVLIDRVIKGIVNGEYDFEIKKKPYYWELNEGQKKFVDAEKKEIQNFVLNAKFKKGNYPIPRRNKEDKNYLHLSINKDIKILSVYCYKADVDSYEKELLHVERVSSMNEAKEFIAHNYFYEQSGHKIFFDYKESSITPTERRKQGLIDSITDDATPLIPAVDYSQSIQDSINALQDINPREASKLKLLQYVLDLQDKTSRTKIESYAKELGLQHAGHAEHKVIKEIIELSIVLSARGKSFEEVLAIYENQPLLTARTSVSIDLQQYSTSLPIAWIIGKFCQLNKEGRYFEPSAGNGMLTIYGDPKNFTVNDIDKDRIWSLRKQGFKEVLNQDGKEAFDLENFDAIITNPPFGAVEKGQLYKGVNLSKLEHKMSANALELLKKDGKSAIIVGGHLEYEENKIKGLQDWFYFVYLASNYNVVDVININSRALYHKMGTTFNLKIILIDGCKHKPVNIESEAYDSIDRWLLNKDLPQSEKFSIEPVSSFEILNSRVNG